MKHLGGMERMVCVCRGNGHGRCCNRQRVLERGARAASHLRCEMRAETQGFTQVRPPEGKDLLLLDCIMEVVQWASSAARRRVAWVYDERISKRPAGRFI